MNDLWDEQPVDVNLREMDALVKDMRARREAYDEAKKHASELYKEFAEVEGKVLQALKAAGKKSYKAEGVGTFSIVNKQVVTVPKNLEDKRKVFEWITDKYGDDVLDSMRSINHMTLNSFYNEEVKKADDPSMFDIPGLEAPTIKEETRFRKG